MQPLRVGKAGAMRRAMQTQMQMHCLRAPAPSTEYRVPKSLKRTGRNAREDLNQLLMFYREFYDDRNHPSMSYLWVHRPQGTTRSLEVLEGDVSLGASMRGSSGLRCSADGDMRAEDYLQLIGSCLILAGGLTALVGWPGLLIAVAVLGISDLVIGASLFGGLGGRRP